jgi:hypothetical protein
MSDNTSAENIVESPALQDDEYRHVVGKWQTWAYILLRRVPRALCGLVMVADPDRPSIGPDAPGCPACLARSGGDLGQWVPPGRAWWI